MQTRLPDETLVLEDGDCEESREQIELMRGRIPNLRYLNQADEGFRLARLRNIGLAASTKTYLISIDGDLLLHPHFVSDHLKTASEGYFVQGTRQKLSPALSLKLLQDKRIPRGLELGFGRERGNKFRGWGLRSALLSHIFSRNYAQPRKISGCHQAFFRKDLIRVNGYDNQVVGWGEEDQYLAARLIKAGLVERLLRFAAVAWHLYHPARKRVNLPTAHVTTLRALDGYEELLSEDPRCLLL